MSTLTDNGYPVLDAGDHRIHRWVIPARTGEVVIPLRWGCVGFILAHYLLWYAETIESLAGKILDDWGWAPFRWVRGYVGFVSNHCSGSAVDANALRHVLGKKGTLAFKVAGLPARVRILARLRLYSGCLRSGEFYRTRTDAMHTEVVKPLADVNKVALRMMRTKRGRRILAANPGQGAVIRTPVTG